jgi:hypothetical protein
MHKRSGVEVAAGGADVLSLARAPCDDGKDNEAEGEHRHARQRVDQCQRDLKDAPRQDSPSPDPPLQRTFGRTDKEERGARECAKHDQGAEHGSVHGRNLTIPMACAKGASILSWNPARHAPVDRHLDFDAIENFRDFGGYDTACGRGLVRGRLYRSGNHSLATEADLARLKALSIGAIVDLRHPLERAREPSRRWPDFDGAVIENDIGSDAADWVEAEGADGAER